MQLIVKSCVTFCYLVKSTHSKWSNMLYSSGFDIGTASLAALSNYQHSSQRQPILCLHGWLDNAASFIPLAGYLPELPLLAVEFPGHGHSSHRGPDAHYYFFDWVQDLVLLCRQQNWQQLTIIGHSMGGMVATALAASFPELVARLILIDSIGFITDEPEHAARQLREGISSRLKPAGRKPHYASIAEAATARQRQSDFSLAQALVLTERGTMVTPSGITWRADMRLRHSSVYRLSQQQANALCSAVACPVLALLAEDGLIIDRVPSVASTFRQLEICRVYGGHHCHMTEPAAVATPIRAFLSR